MNDFKELTIRRNNPLEFFKSIKFCIEYPKKITAYLVYLRKNYSGYDYNKGDNIDVALQSFFKSSFDSVKKGYETILIVEEQLQNAIKITNGGAEKDVIFHFMPTPSIKLFNECQNKRILEAESVKLRITFMTNEFDLANISIQNEYIVDIDNPELIMINTIKKI